MGRPTPPENRDPLETGPNAIQVEYWNETSGPGWVSAQARIDGQVTPPLLPCRPSARTEGIG